MEASAGGTGTPSAVIVNLNGKGSVMAHHIKGVKHKVAVLFAAVLFPFFQAASPPQKLSFEGLSPKEIVDRVDRLLRGDSSHGLAVMSIVTRHWQRSKTLEIWSKGTEDALVRVLEPRKEEGVATLKVGTDIWNYLPRIDRTIRIPTSMMMASWMGSHFTNDDLVKESRLIRDYEITLEFEGPRQGVPVWEFRLTPHPDAPVVWGRVEYRIRKDDLMPLWAKYYGEDGELKRVLAFSEFRKMGGRLVPVRMRMEPTDKPGEYTEIFYRDLKFDIPVPEGMFSLSALRKKQ